ncbi:caspase family protein [bacterium]|nr:caspase family protein [bacterium]
MADAVAAAQALVARHTAELAAANLQLRRARTMAQRRAAERAVAAAQSALQAAQKQLTDAQAAAAAVAVKTGGLTRVLTVGINYTGTPYELAGCINDATNMAGQTRAFFPACKEYRLITDNTPEKPTKANILAAIGWLVSGLKAGENVLFHFAGHGGLVRDTNGDEVSGRDSCLYPLNGRTLETLTDDELRAALAERLPEGCKCLVVLDCCHSGTAVDLRYKWQAPAAGTMTYTEDQKYSKTAGQVLFLSGCRDTETAADTVNKEGRPCGAMTMALLETWRTYGPAIKLKYLLWDVRKFLLDNGYRQVPELTTGSWMDMNAVWDLGRAT